MKYMSVLVPLCFVLTSVCSEDAPGFAEGIVTSLKHCLHQKEKMDCLKRKVIVKLENEMNSNRTLEISDGIYLKRDPDAVHENSVMGGRRFLSTGVSEARGSVLNSLLMSRVLDYFKTSVVQFKLADSVDEGRFCFVLFHFEQKAVRFYN